MVEMFLTVEQAAERLQVHRATIRRHLRSGTLQGVRRGRDWRIPESALGQASGSKAPAEAQAAALWAQMKSGDPRQHNDALRALFAAPEEVQAIVMQRSQEAASAFYATPEGAAELADWRALDGEPFEDDGGDYFSAEEEAQFRADRERQAQEAAPR